LLLNAVFKNILCFEIEVGIYEKFANLGQQLYRISSVFSAGDAQTVALMQ